MSAFAEAVDQLITLEARAKAIGSISAPLRQKVTAMLLDRFAEEGVSQVRRSGAVVSIIEPKPFAEVTRPEALCEWLTEQGREELVTSQLVQTDSHATRALQSVLDLLNGEDRNDWRDIVTDLAVCFDVRSQPVTDWYDHVAHEVAGDGTMVAAGGEVIPGARWIVPEPRSIRVLIDKDLREMVAADVADEVAV